jgi:hypothetical protein
MDLQELPVLGLDVRWDEIAESHRRIGQHRAHCLVQAIDLLGAERPPFPQRRQLGGPQDLVAVRIPDSSSPG